MLLNNGDGTFAPRTDYAAGASPGAARAADINGDGQLDLAVQSVSAANLQNNRVDVLLGNGDGSFEAPQAVLTLPSMLATPMVVADFNGDGRLDLVERDSTGFAIERGNGDGTFGQGTGWFFSDPFTSSAAAAGRVAAGPAGTLDPASEEGLFLRDRSRALWADSVGGVEDARRVRAPRFARRSALFRIVPGRTPGITAGEPGVALAGVTSLRPRSHTPLG